MPTGVNNYERKCKKCKKIFIAKMGIQKYCLACGNYIQGLRQMGFKGDWSSKAERDFLKAKKK